LKTLFVKAKIVIGMLKKLDLISNFQNARNMSKLNILVVLFSIVAILISFFSFNNVQAIQNAIPVLSSSSPFVYCTNSNPSYTVNNFDAAKFVIGNKTYFYVTQNTSLNVVNGQCANNRQRNFVPYIQGHSVGFELDNFGVPTNVKVFNKAPTVQKAACDGENTYIKFVDSNQDLIQLATVTGNTDFFVGTANDLDGSLRVSFSRNNANFRGANDLTIYASETFTSNNLEFGFVNYFSSAAAVRGYAEVLNRPSTSKVAISVQGICNPNLYNPTSSSSSQSISSTSSSLTSNYSSQNSFSNSPSYSSSANSYNSYNSSWPNYSSANYSSMNSWSYSYSSSSWSNNYSSSLSSSSWYPPYPYPPEDNRPVDRNALRQILLDMQYRILDMFYRLN
jgi:hypothetical protein